MSQGNKAVAVYLNTGNPGKIAEYRQSLPDIKFVNVEVKENGGSFAANSFLKARGAWESSSQLGEMSEEGEVYWLGEDSGICVDCLNGGPGIYSKRIRSFRFSQTGEMSPGRVPEKVESNDRANCQYLLDLLAERGELKAGASARYRIALSVVDSKGELIDILEAECPISLVDDFCDEQGFGYDWIAVHEQKGHFGRISAEEKREVSHRGQVGRLFADWLKNQTK